MVMVLVMATAMIARCNYCYLARHMLTPKMATHNICLISNDGINTHILEYLFGIYLHLWSILELKYIICILINGEFDIRTNNTDC